MTTQAKEIDVVHDQQARIGRAMGRVAVQATRLGLHRRMLEDEGSHGIGMALGTDSKLSSRGAHLVAGLRPVRIVAVAALDQPHVDAVPVRPRKFRLLRCMASVAEVLLRLHQHEIHVTGFVWAVTRSTTDAICQVLGLGEVLRLQA